MVPSEGAPLTILTRGIPLPQETSAIMSSQDLDVLVLEHGVVVTLGGGNKFPVSIDLSLPDVGYNHSINGSDPKAVELQRELLSIYMPVFTNQKLVNPHGTKIDINIKRLLLDMFKGLDIGEQQVFGFFSGHFDHKLGRRVDSTYYPIEFSLWEEVIHGLDSGVFMKAAAARTVETGPIDKEYTFTLLGGTIYFSPELQKYPFYR